MDATVLKKGGAALSSDSLGKPAVSLKIADQDLFYEVTSELAQKSSGENMIVTWLDFVEEKTLMTVKRSRRIQNTFLLPA